MAGEQELKLKNKNKVQKIIFIVNVMRTIINPHTNTHGRLNTSFQTKEDPRRLYIFVG